MKQQKIDIRLTEDQMEWIEAIAEYNTISKAAVIRQIIEGNRRTQINQQGAVAESPTEYGVDPKKAKTLVDSALKNSSLKLPAPNQSEGSK